MNKHVLGVIMDSIAGINPKKDTTFALLLEAQRLGWHIFYMESCDLVLKHDLPYAYMRALTLHDHGSPWYSLGESMLQPLVALACILMRKDPPVDQAYLCVTQLLERAQQQGVLIVNRPQSLRDYNEKLFALQFPQCCPPTLVTANMDAAKAFLAEQQDVIVKPLNGMGGASIFRLKKGDANTNVVLETLSVNQQRHFLVQRYIPDILDGDKRILIVNGEPVPYALARIPKEGETRANLVKGGQGVAVKLSEHDRWICQQVTPTLLEKGILLAGLDVIGEYLTEINITSPTGMRELDEQCQLNIAGQLFAAWY